MKDSHFKNVHSAENWKVNGNLLSGIASINFDAVWAYSTLDKKLKITHKNVLSWPTLQHEFCFKDYLKGLPTVDFFKWMEILAENSYMNYYKVKLQITFEQFWHTVCTVPVHRGKFEKMLELFCPF